jgi:hypothetical protein
MLEKIISYDSVSLRAQIKFKLVCVFLIACCTLHILMYLCSRRKAADTCLMSVTEVIVVKAQLFNNSVLFSHISELADSIAIPCPDPRGTTVSGWERKFNRNTNTSDVPLVLNSCPKAPKGCLCFCCSPALTTNSSSSSALNVGLLFCL